MTTLTLNIPEALMAALEAAGRERSLPGAAVAVQVLEHAMLPEPQKNKAQLWIEEWRGRLKGKESSSDEDPRLQHLLAKHLR